MYRSIDNFGVSKKGMPDSLVVIEYNGDYVTCIDTLKDSDNQIVTWFWLHNGIILKKPIILKSIL